jgi:hypothetical protein
MGRSWPASGRNSIRTGFGDGHKAIRATDSITDGRYRPMLFVASEDRFE